MARFWKKKNGADESDELLNVELSDRDDGSTNQSLGGKSENDEEDLLDQYFQAGLDSEQDEGSADNESEASSLDGSGKPPALDLLLDVESLDADETGESSVDGPSGDDDEPSDDLMAIFEAADVEDSDLSALTQDLEDVGIDELLALARETLNSLLDID